MHPAPSIIIFTVFSGLGFGLMAYLGFDTDPLRGWSVLPYYLIAFSLSIVGLLSSLFHLGNPQRAWRALSQWRTSWLSREGVLAIVTLALNFLFGLSLFFSLDYSKNLGFVSGIFAIITVFSTAMIYAQMKTVPRWNNSGVPILFILCSLAGGAIIMGDFELGLIGVILSSGIQLLVWVRGDKALKNSSTNISTSTGLKNLGKLRLLESPHTGENYLMKEMVFVIARKHVLKLRILSLCFLGVIPVIFLILSLSVGFLIGLAMISYFVGLLISRWLFFAQAEHVVSFYYGRS